MARVLTSGDTHCPFMHKRYPEFLERIRDQYRTDSFVHIGDEVDLHGMSFHTSETDAPGVAAECDMAQQQLNDLFDIFGDAKVCIGNHSRLPERRAKEAKIPQRWLKNYGDAWGAPKGWKWNNRWIIDGVLYTHGTSAGKMAHLQLAKDERMSAVQGHTHSFGGVNYASSNHDLIFGMNAGCGIDCSAMAFRYGRDFRNRPTLGCGVVIDGFEAIFIPMILKNKRLRKPQIVVPAKYRGRGKG